jgi:hypothetical protein
MAKGEIGFLTEGWKPTEPLEKHVAESKWQYCMCRSCQYKRNYLDSLPGKKIDYNTFRNRDENY